MRTTVQPPELKLQEAVPVDDGLHEAPPRLDVTRRNLLLLGLFVVSSVAFLYFVLPRIAGLDETWNRLHEGDPWWLFIALVFTVMSFAGYMLLFHGVFVRCGNCGNRIDFMATYQITMAGLAATRLFAAGGAGGLVLTAWALRAAGLPRRTVADQTLAFLVLTYAVFMISLIVGGLGLYLGVFHGPAPFAMTIVPAILATIAIIVTLLLAIVPTDLQNRLEDYADSHGKLARFAQRAANAPAAFSTAVRVSLAHLRAHDSALFGAIAFWAFNIMVLWAAFRAFGAAPPGAVIVMAYFVGMLGNLLPLPGGVGGVDGGMIGAFAAFGVDTGLAVVAVLVYRGFAFWLPTIPGAVAYFQLRKTVDRWRRDRTLEQAGTREVPATA